MENEQNPLTENNPAKIRWQCRRGMLELDLLLFSFFDEYYHTLDEQNKKIFHNFLESSDPELLDWLLTQEKPPDQYKDLVRKILSSQKNKIEL